MSEKYGHNISKESPVSVGASPLFAIVPCDEEMKPRDVRHGLGLHVLQYGSYDEDFAGMWGDVILFKSKVDANRHLSVLREKHPDDYRFFAVAGVFVTMSLTKES